MARQLPGHLAGCLLVVACALTAQAAAPADVESEILRLEKATNDAYAVNDLPTYFGFYADDAVLIFYNKRTYVPAYRKMWTEAIKTEPIASVKLSDMVIRQMASDTAVASYQIVVRTDHPSGKTTEEHSFETDVWVKRSGDWKLAHVHYSVMPTTPGSQP